MLIPLPMLIPLRLGRWMADLLIPLNLFRSFSR